MHFRKRNKILLSNLLFLFLLLFSIQSTRTKSNSIDLFPQKNSNTSEILQESTILREQINVQPLIDMGYDGSGIKIGIIDTGVNASHPEFQNKEILAKSFVTVENGYSSDNLSTLDNIGHGTAVAGLAVGKNLGIAPGASIISAKIFESGVKGNAGFVGEETSEAILEAMKWLVEEQNVSIINFSLSQYHNLLNEGREWIINKYSLERNIISVVAAGNSGESGINLASMGNPSTSLQAITVGASDGMNSIAEFTANGPRVDWTMKPDVVAPGVNLIKPNFRNSGESSGSGTSFAAPLVSGAVAILISALKDKGIRYAPGMIKGALIETADEIQNEDYYPWWQQGAGLIDVDKAFNYIINSIDSVDNKPKFFVPFPKSLPFEPLNTLFQGQSIGFNLSIISSNEFFGTILVLDNNLNLISTPNEKLFKDTTLVSVWIDIPNNTPTGIYNMTIQIDSNESEEDLFIPINFSVKTPKLKILFDETHNGLVNQVLGLGDNINEIDDPWGDSNFIFGSFLEFFMKMTSNSISVTPFREGGFDNISFMNKFDTIILPYPATRLTSPFTDWWNDLENFPDSNIINPTLGFTDTELLNLKKYVVEESRNLIILTSYPEMHDIAELNKLLNLFNISYVDLTYNIELSFDNTHTGNKLTEGVSSIQYIGGALKPELDYEGVVWGKLSRENDYGFANWHVETGGNFFVSGTGFFMENIGLRWVNPAFQTNHDLFMENILKYISNSELNPVTVDSEINATPSFTISDLTFSITVLLITIIFLKFKQRKT